MQTIEEILDFLKGNDVNIKKVSEETGISADKLYSWRAGRGTPKAADSQILLEWGANKNKNSNGFVEIQNPDQMYMLTELVNSLKKNVEILEKRGSEQENIIKELIKANGELKSEVQGNLKTVLDNQLTLTVLFESYLKSFSSLMIEEPAQQQEFRLLLHKDAFVRLTEISKTGNRHLSIDSEDIIADRS